MVTIIVPVYNIKEYLPACVKSLRAQTAQDIQILLVNDGSTDGSAELCDAFGTEDARITVIHKPNGGLSSARNAGLEAATGEWILFLDGDDYLLPRTVELLLQVTQSHPDADFIQFLYQETPDTGWQPQNVPGEEMAYHVETDAKAFFQRMYTLGGAGASACTKLLRRSMFNDLRFREGICHEDEEMMTRLLPKCSKGVYTELVLYGYRMRPGSIIRSDFKPSAMDVFPVMEDRVEVLHNLDCTDLVQQTYQRLFQTAANLYCKARRAGLRAQTAMLKKHIQALAKESIPGLSGQYKLLHRLTAITGTAPGAYYLIRRLCGKS